MTLSGRQKIGFGLIVTLAAAAVLIAVLAGSDAERASAERASSGAEALAALVPAAQADLDRLPDEVNLRLQFHALRSERATGESPPVDSLAAISRDGETTYLVGYGPTICVFFEAGAGTCNDLQSVLAGQTYVAEPIGCQGWRILGIAPDEVANVVVTDEDEEAPRATSSVRSNTYVATVANRDVTLLGLDSTGERVFEVNVPVAGFSSGHCSRF